MKRRGYILVFVLGVTSVVTALGLSYIAANGTVMTQATNRYAAVRAQYVAESGAVLAQHFIHYPPTTVAYNGVYAGGTGIAIDGTFDTVDITVTPTTPANHYTIQATSVVRNATGTEALAKQKTQCDAIVPPEPKWKLSQALLLPNSATIPSGVTITGNIHSNGNLAAWGTCTGAVTATGTAGWYGGGPPTSVQSSRPAIAAPPVSTSLYTTYTINGTTYTAYSGYANSDLKSSDLAGLNSAVNSGGNNPGRIVYCKSGDFTIKDDMTFTGTLLVRGHLHIDGKNITLNAVPNYPALVVTGEIKLKKTQAEIVVNGTVVCGEEIDDENHTTCQLTINGALVTGDGIDRAGSGTTIRIVWDAAKSTFWDFTKTANPEPVTVLEWKEN